MSILKLDQIQSRTGTDITLGNRLVGTQIDYSIMPSGSVIGMKSIRNSTRTSIGTVVAPFTLFSGTFTKQRADTIIIATCTVFGAQYASGNCDVSIVRICDYSDWTGEKSTFDSGV